MLDLALALLTDVRSAGGRPEAGAPDVAAPECPVARLRFASCCLANASRKRLPDPRAPTAGLRGAETGEPPDAPEPFGAPLRASISTISFSTEVMSLAVSRRTAGSKRYMRVCWKTRKMLEAA